MCKQIYMYTKQICVYQKYILQFSKLVGYVQVVFLSLSYFNEMSVSMYS